MPYATSAAAFAVLMNAKPFLMGSSMGRCELWNCLVSNRECRILICSIRFVIYRQTATADAVWRSWQNMLQNITLCLVTIRGNQALIFDPDSDPERKKPVRTA